ncbi:MAG TPA: hypothetical protein ENG05_00130, partial [Acidilobales archaeon]|nr:hypothetical protein [Acidilobales archaeon]
MKALIVPTASPLHDPGLVSEVLDRILNTLRDIDAEVHKLITDVGGVEELSRDYDTYIVPILTGGTEHIVLKLVSKGVPIALIAHETQNSLAAALEVKAKLDSMSYPNSLLLLSDTLSHEVRSFLRASHVYRRLRNLKIILLGDPSPWLVYSNEGVEFIKELGIEVVRIDISDILSNYEKVGDSEVDDLLGKFVNIERIEPSLDDLRKALRLYVLLK